MNSMNGLPPTNNVAIGSVNSPNGEMPVQLTRQQMVQQVFTSTSCYELMQPSSKGTVFETTIPFQLAFFALIEHDTDVAPLWDPELRSFVGLMTIEDYITAIRLSKLRNMNPLEITSKPISELLLSTPYLFKNAEFQAIEAEEPVLQLTTLLYKQNYDYIPIVDPENGNLISILGKLDILHLLTQIHKLQDSIFTVPIASLPIGTYRNLITVTKQTLLTDALELCNKHALSALPVVEVGTQRVVGIYHMNDISFIMKANDVDMIITNLTHFKIEDAMIIRDQLIASGEMISSHFQSLLTCKSQDHYIHVLQAMVLNRSTRVIVIDDMQVCKGVITFHDLIAYFLEDILC